MSRKKKVDQHLKTEELDEQLFAQLQQKNKAANKRHNKQIKYLEKKAKLKEVLDRDWND